MKKIVTSVELPVVEGFHWEPCTYDEWLEIPAARRAKLTNENRVQTFRQVPDFQPRWTDEQIKAAGEAARSAYQYQTGQGPSVGAFWRYIARHALDAAVKAEGRGMKSTALNAESLAEEAYAYINQGSEYTISKGHALATLAQVYATLPDQGTKLRLI